MMKVRLTEQEGSFAPGRSSVHLELAGVNTRPESVLANGEEAGWDYEEADSTITVRLAQSAGETTVEARFRTGS